MPERQSPSVDEFFIGWLPVPRGYTRFLRAITPAVLLLTAGIAATLSLWQQTPGLGVWEAGEIVSVDGILQAEPYAMLWTHGDTDSQSGRAILLVEEGKFGASNRARPFEGKYVRATGTFLHRDGRWMLELSSDESSLKLTSSPGESFSATIPVHKPLAGGPVTLQGELIDPKCYLGAMRPGGGKTHKACAILCISGGIPPMLVTRDAENREIFYLLTTNNGAAANDSVLPFVGDLVEVEGNLLAAGDLLIFQLSPGGIRRL